PEVINNDVQPGPSANISSSEIVHDKRENEILVNADDGLNDDQWNEGDICRVCRLSGDESALFHPCLCTGSIKYVHQHCLLEWLKYSKKTVCELCGHKFVFRPVYREDMPTDLPLTELAHGLFSMIYRYVRLFCIYVLATICWCGIVPLVACRVHRMVFEGSILNSITNLYLLNVSSIAAIFSPHEIVMDIFRGTTIVAIFLCTFILLVFLREQIINGGPPELFNFDPPVEAVIDLANPIPPPAPLVQQQQPPRNPRNQALFEFLNNIDANEIPNPNGQNPGAQALQQELDAVDLIPEPPVEQAAVAEVEEAENWGRDVERIVEDLTWQRLLGLDGSLVFIEHVIWMISLNVIFIVLCMFFPCKLGEFCLYFLGMQTKGVYFEPAINFFVGYIAILFSVVISHQLMKLFRIKDAYWLLGFFFLMMKVSLLIVLEVFVFPSFCGWWLDICALPLTGSTLKLRLKTLTLYPISCVFVHWLVGMIDVFYSASFVLVLRDLLRPGVLVGFVFSSAYCILLINFSGFIIFVMVYLPLKMIQLILPSVLPYSFNLATEMPLGEFSFELILLQVILPTVLEQSVAAQFLKGFVILWCKHVGSLLGLAEYLLPRNVLLGLPADAVVVVQNVAPVEANLNEINANVADDTDSNDSEDDEEEVDGGNDVDVPDAAVPAPLPVVAPFLQNNVDNTGDDFVKPSYFGIRILTLLFCLSVTGVMVSFLLIVLPVTMGRNIVSFILNSKNPNDLYTVALGLYIVWLCIKAWMVARMWVQQGLAAITSAAIFLSRVTAAAIPLVLIIPYLIGIYFQLLVVGPLRVASHQTPLYFPFKDWAMGLVHFKLFCASVFVGPEWWLKTVFERLYEDGIRNYNVGVLYMQVVIPVIMFISFLICFPYVMGSLCSFAFGLNYENQLTVIRYMYPGTVSVFLILLFVAWQWSKMKKLANKIRNDKYLIGTQLVNFYREGQLKLKQN
uniref:RING-CH-type domain-containing protein n=1 Tax=Panagrolaimus sp. ES5 TaxID=591445 RepID=A0AC34FFM4_9BILA